MEDVFLPRRLAIGAVIAAGCGRTALDDPLAVSQADARPAPVPDAPADRAPLPPPPEPPADPPGIDAPVEPAPEPPTEPGPDLPPDLPPTEVPKAPSPLRPWNGENTGSVWQTRSRRPAFRWTPVVGAERYEIQADDTCPVKGYPDCAFPSPELVAAATDARFAPASDLTVATTAPVGRRYFWRVRACNSLGCSAWSAVRYANVARQLEDVNGDGYADVLASGASAGYGKTDGGIFFGGATPDDTLDVPVASGGRSNDFVAMVGDVNADGYADFAVSGAIYLGAAKPVMSIGLGGPFGSVWAIAGAGDVDADGYCDVIAGDPTGAGKAALFLGGAPMDAMPDLMLAGEASLDEFGVSVSSAGDMNGDGYADVAIGAHWNDEGGGNAGRAYVYFGGAKPDDKADVIVTGEEPGGRLGTSVAPGGDVNADGYADLLVGSLGWMDTGRVGICSGGPAADGKPDGVLASASTGDAFGISVASAGDANDDGYDDIVVGAYFSGVGGRDVGRAYLFMGGVPIDPAPDVTMGGPRTDSFLGRSVSGAGDVNGDGHPDFVVGAPGGGKDIPPSSGCTDCKPTRGGRADVHFGGPKLDGVPDLSLFGGRDFGNSVACRWPAAVRGIRGAA